MYHLELTPKSYELKYIKFISSVPRYSVVHNILPHTVIHVD
jgi:hypothetical protein